MSKPIFVLTIPEDLSDYDLRVKLTGEIEKRVDNEYHVLVVWGVGKGIKLGCEVLNGNKTLKDIWVCIREYIKYKFK